MGCEMGLKVSLPLITIGAANAFGWLFVYLRGAIVIADWITGIAGHDPHLIMLLMVALFTVIGDFIEPVPTIIIFMPLVNALTDAGNINPVHMGVVLITTLAFWTDHAALRPRSFDGIKIRRCAFLTCVEGGVSDLCRVLRYDRLHDLLPVSGALAAKTSPSRFGRLLP